MTDQGQTSYVIIVAKARGQLVRDRLTNKGIFDSNRKIYETATGTDELEIPVTTITNIREILHDIQFSHRIIQFGKADKATPATNAEKGKVSMSTQLVQHFKQVIFCFKISIFFFLFKYLDMGMCF